MHAGKQSIRPACHLSCVVCRQLKGLALGVPRAREGWIEGHMFHARSVVCGGNNVPGCHGGGRAQQVGCQLLLSTGLGQWLLTEAMAVCKMAYASQAGYFKLDTISCSVVPGFLAMGFWLPWLLACLTSFAFLGFTAPLHAHAAVWRPTS